jgi:glycosyltransferase involved in cell wall biosynthesis
MHKRPGTLAVAILTRNEEKNLPQALASVAGWSHETFVLDSQSTDRTLDIALNFGCTIAANAFEDYAKQRNYALDHLPITSEWVLFLDADEWLPEPLKSEIVTLIAASPVENGFYVNRRLIWMGRWLRHGYYPSWILRLFRFKRGRCEDRTINEQICVEGSTGYLRNDLVHEDHKGVSEWIIKHNGYAAREALELVRTKGEAGYREVDAQFFAGQSLRKRWLRQNVWNRLPPLLRPCFYFFYRYLLAGGFLDGKAALIYHFLHALWYPMLIDIKYLELLSERTGSLSREALPADRTDFAGVLKSAGRSSTSPLGRSAHD